MNEVHNVVFNRVATEVRLEKSRIFGSKGCKCSML